MKKPYVIVIGAAFVLALGACDVEQTEKAELPEVEVKGGNMPEYDVDAADVDVKTEKRTIEVPVVDIDEADAGAPDPK